MKFFSVSRFLTLLIITSVAMLGVRGVNFWDNWQSHGQEQHRTASRVATIEAEKATRSSMISDSSSEKQSGTTGLGVGYSAQAQESNGGASASEADGHNQTSSSQVADRRMPVVPLGASVNSYNAGGVSPVRGSSESIPRAFSPAEVEVLQDLSRRRVALDKREAALDRREALITAAAQQVDTKVAELQEIREELRQLLNMVDEHQKERIASLVKIYETMKPRDAAAIIETLEQSVALSVLEEMREAKSAPILAAMSPAKASELTVAMSQRQKLPELPEE